MASILDLPYDMAIRIGGSIYDEQGASCTRDQSACHAHHPSCPLPSCKP